MHRHFKITVLMSNTENTTHINKRTLRFSLIFSDFQEIQKFENCWPRVFVRTQGMLRLNRQTQGQVRKITVLS